MFTEFNKNNLNISLLALRSAYFSLYNYTNNGEKPTQIEINQIQSEEDYIRIINPIILADDFTIDYKSE